MTDEQSCLDSASPPEAESAAFYYGHIASVSRFAATLSRTCPDAASPPEAEFTAFYYGHIASVSRFAATLSRGCPDSASRRKAEFTAFYHEHFAAVSRFARTWGRSYHDAEDAAAEAMQEMFRQWDSVAAEKRVETVYTITRNKYVSMVRRAITRQKHLRSADARPRETSLESRIELLDTSEAVQKLPRRRRQLLILDVEGLSHAEIAHVFGITEESVTQELSRARKALRRAMGRSQPDRRRKPREDTAWEGGTST
ncbi:RNA polymerase sigma factor [Amycolatopsis sp. NPDC051758]|uniref:RNA polymerase sigma factor n=1 Tax=Amycolatopsis sp. NPDC051758 TaxID=3363935 RepID=UPI0037BAAA7E